MLRPKAADARGSGGKTDEPNFSFLVTLLTMLDFSEPGKVTQEDWDRGMGNLWAPGVGSAVSWGSLQKRFDKGGSGQIDFGEIIGLAPLDPRLEQLLRVLLQSLVRLSEKVDRTTDKVHKANLKSAREGINRWRNKLSARVFMAWRDAVSADDRRRRQVLGTLKYAPCRKCLVALRAMLAQKRVRIARVENMIRGGAARLQEVAFSQWREGHDAHNEARAAKLVKFFGSREDWWKLHVVATWKLHTRHEKSSRGHLLKWQHQGNTKVFVGWRRYARREVEALYGKHNPEKLAEVDTLLAKYGELKLLSMVRRKYGVASPAASSATTAPFTSSVTGGKPTQPAGGGEAQRISFGRGRYGTPVWSPRGDLIAFTKQSKGRFHIGVMRVDGSEERLLTASFLDEGPTWSPNGRVIMFHRETQGASGRSTLYSVDITGRNLRPVRTPEGGSDPSWSPLQK